VIMKKLCKQEVIGMRMHQFKVSGLNSTLNLRFLLVQCANVEIGIANVNQKESQIKCTLFKPLTLN